MERRSWTWKRRPAVDSNSGGGGGETESSGSVSSERYFDEQDVLRASPDNYSSSHAQLQEVTSKSGSEEDNETSKSLTEKSPSFDENETIKILTEKLSSALSSISSKEELVRQHATVAEEAVLGWEKAEKEVTSLKQQLDAFVKKNSSLEDKVCHLDGTLKECVRQLRQSREEQEQKLHEVNIKRRNDWDAEKAQLEIQIIELEKKMEAEIERTTSADKKLSSQVEALQKENSSLKLQLASLTEDLQVQTLEMEFSTKSAETASKQNLENIKKVAKLEAECRRLHNAARKSLFPNEHKIISNSLYVESLTDSQSDSGEKLVSLDNEPSCSDSWASALIAELDQFKNEKAARNLANYGETDLMDDFLEMERIAALPSADCGSSNFEHEVNLDSAVTRDNLSRNETETMKTQIAEMQAKIEKMAMENLELEMSLDRTQNDLKAYSDQLLQSETKLLELQRQINLVNREKHALEMELEGVVAKKSEMQSQLEQAHKQNRKLQEEMSSLEGKFQEERLSTAKLLNKCQDMETIIEKAKGTKLELESANREFTRMQEKTTIIEQELNVERALSAELEFRCQNMDAMEVKRKETESQLELANLELAKLHEKVKLLEKKLEEKVFSAKMSVESVEMEREKLDCQLKSANLEIQSLKQNFNILEAELEDARAISTKLAADSNEIDKERKELILQLELVHKEVTDLQERLFLVEKQAEKEKALKDKALSAEFAAKCQSLQHELSSKKYETELLKSSSSNAPVKIRQDNEVAAAAGRLAECQKTIASLKLQVKSLSTLDVFVPDKPELNGVSWNSTLDSRSSPVR